MPMKNKAHQKKSFHQIVLSTPDIMACYQKGLQALKQDHRQRIHLAASADGSVEIDEATRLKYPNDARWDYVFGYQGKAYFVEFHNANKTKEVDAMIKKLKWLNDWLTFQAPELKKIKANKFYWIQSNTNHIKSAAKLRKLVENNILVKKQITDKTLGL
jgi:hypothetical protein